VAWANYDKSASRRDVIARLMQHVRLPLLSQDFLVQRVEQEPLIKNNSACKDFLIEALKYHLLRPEQKIHFASPRTKHRSPAGLPKVWSWIIWPHVIPTAVRIGHCQLHGRRQPNLALVLYVYFCYYVLLVHVSF